MFRKFAQALKTPLLAAAVASASQSSALAVEITGLGFTNHSHDQFGDATAVPGSPFFTGTVHATNGTQYVTEPANGLHGSIKSPNSTVDSPTGLALRLLTFIPLYCGGLWLAVTCTPPAQSRWLMAK